MTGMTERGQSVFLSKDFTTKDLMGGNMNKFSSCASHKTTTCLADYEIYCSKI